MAEEVDYSRAYSQEVYIKIRDLEEKQRILKDRAILIGQNLIELKEKTSDDIISIKKDIESLKKSVERIKSFMENISTEFSKFAKNDDLNILAKQMKMFQPLRYSGGIEE